MIKNEIETGKKKDKKLNKINNKKRKQINKKNKKQNTDARHKMNHNQTFTESGYSRTRLMIIWINYSLSILLYKGK